MLLYDLAFWENLYTFLYVIANIGDDIEIALNIATKKPKEFMLYVATGIKATSNWFKPLKQVSLALNENIGTVELADKNEPNN